MSENHQYLITPIMSGAIAIGAALLASWITHLLTSRRDKINEQRKLRTTILLDAFCKFLKNSNMDIGDAYPDLIDSIVKIQALGTPKQVELCEKFITNMIENKVASSDELITDLRSQLRRDLGAEPIHNIPMWFRAYPIEELISKQIRLRKDNRAENPMSQNSLYKGQWMIKNGIPEFASKKKASNLGKPQPRSNDKP